MNHSQNFGNNLGVKRAAAMLDTTMKQAHDKNKNMMDKYLQLMTGYLEYRKEADAHMAQQMAKSQAQVVYQREAQGNGAAEQNQAMQTMMRNLSKVISGVLNNGNLDGPAIKQLLTTLLSSLVTMINTK